MVECEIASDLQSIWKSYWENKSIVVHSRADEWKLENLLIFWIINLPWTGKKCSSDLETESYFCPFALTLFFWFHYLQNNKKKGNFLVGLQLFGLFFLLREDLQLKKQGHALIFIFLSFPLYVNGTAAPLCNSLVCCFDLLYF